MSELLTIIHEMPWWFAPILVFEALLAVGLLLMIFRQNKGRFP